MINFKLQIWKHISIILYHLSWKMISFEQVCFHEWCNASFMETKDPCVSVCYAQYGAMLFCINSMNVIDYKSIYHREITKLLYLWKMFLHFVSVMLKGVWSILFVVNWILLNMNVHARFLYTIVSLGFESFYRPS